MERDDTSCCFSSPSRLDREKSRWRPVKGSYVGIGGRRGETNEARAAHGKSGAQSCARWGSDLNLGLERLRRESLYRRPKYTTTTLPYFLATSTEKYTVVILARIAHAAHDVEREKGEGGGIYHCDCIMQRDRRCIPRLRERRRRACIDRILRTVETVLRKKNITAALKYKGDPR